MSSFKLRVHKTVNNNFTDLQFYLLSKFNSKQIENGILTFSDPRGGSTWLVEMIYEIIGAPILFEPLHLRRTNEFKKLGFGWRQHIPENAEWPEAHQAFTKLFKGRILNRNLAKKTSPVNFLTSSALIYKFCRANQIIPWLTANFNFKHKPIYLIRHPFAVVSSQLKHGAWDNVKSMTIPETRYNNLFKTHAEFLTSLKTPEENLTAVWCLCNSETLGNNRNNIDWITINYEEFVTDPKKVFSRIVKIWGINFNLETIDFQRKSKTTKSGSPIKGKEQIEYWKKSLSSKQIVKMKNVLDHFKVDTYDDNPYPRIMYT
jgi:hypothetical protein